MQNLSILSPIYNCDIFIEKAYRNILDQGYLNFEWIIVNDGSNDESESIIQKLIKRDKRINYFKLPRNMGRGFARNFGLMNANFEIIVNWDIDDTYNKKRLISIDKFYSTSDLDYSWEEVNIIDNNKKVNGYLMHTKSYLKCPLHNTLSFKKSIGLKLLYQMLGTTGGIGEDHYFVIMLRALHKGNKLKIRSNYFYTREKYTLKSYHSTLGQLLAITRVIFNKEVKFIFKFKLFFLLLPECIFKIIFYQLLIIFGILKKNFLNLKNP